MRKRPNHSRLGSAFHLWNALPPETSPARSAGSLFDRDKRWAMPALEWTADFGHTLRHADPPLMAPAASARLGSLLPARN
jgi:hypothetical protein